MKFWITLRHAVTGLALAGLLLTTVNQRAEAEQNGEPAFLTLGVGLFDVADEDTAPWFRLEYRPDFRVWKIFPMLGVSANTDFGLYGYFGLGVDIYFGRRLVVTPSAAVGAYEEGDSKDLGGILEFRTGVEVAWRLDDWSRVGLAYHHISNAGIYERNPGTEIATVTFAFPLP